MKIKETGHIYILKSLDCYKIGKSKNYKKRLSHYVTHNPHGITEIICERVRQYSLLEKKLHMRFKDKKVSGEWFRLSNEELGEAINTIIENMSFGLRKMLKQNG